MYNKDAEKIAELYVEYTFNKTTGDDYESKKLTGVLTGILLDKKFPFSFQGETLNSEGDIEDLTVPNMPIKDYQIKNIVQALMNDSLQADYEPKYKDYSEQTISKILSLLHKKMNDSEGDLTQSYHGQKFDPSALQGSYKKKPRWNPGDDVGGVK